jgi:hypothetical protein
VDESYEPDREQPERPESHNDGGRMSRHDQQIRGMFMHSYRILNSSSISLQGTEGRLLLSLSEIHVVWQNQELEVKF